MNILALWIGKLTFLALKIVGRRGAALPGLIVEKLAPKFLDTKLNDLSEGVIIVVGTNGKTTTTKMLTHVLRGNKRVLTNPTGSNFTRGIVASIVENARWNGHLNFDCAVLELDEAYAVKFVALHKPRAVVVLNVMRDQMDRFAEIDQTAKMLAGVVAAATDFVVINIDDSRTAELQGATVKRVITFGVAKSLQKIFLQDDDLHGELTTQGSAKKPDVELIGYENSTASYRVGKNTFMAVLSSQGAHNAQNAAAVLAACEGFNTDISQVITRLAEVEPAFGRGESFDVSGKKITLQLVKNPGGFRHALLGAAAEYSQLMIAINDDYPDGRDVSWLWDVNFKHLEAPIVTTGTRASDMALRLKYDDIAVENIEIDLDSALSAFTSSVPKNGAGIIYATYTAMLELRQHIAKIAEVEKI